MQLATTDISTYECLLKDLILIIFSTYRIAGNFGTVGEFYEGFKVLNHQFKLIKCMHTYETEHSDCQIYKFCFHQI